MTPTTVVRLVTIVCLSAAVLAGRDRNDDGLPSEFRTIDGTNTNLQHPEWGRTGSRLFRLTSPAYADGKEAPAGVSQPGARVISNAVHAQTGSRPNRIGASDLMWQWGQFVDHDISLSAAADPLEPMPIPVPPGDPFFDPLGTGIQEIGFFRSTYDRDTEVREQVNELTAFIDASHVYGSDEERTRALRTLDGSGRLKTSPGDLLPFNYDGLPNAPSKSAEFFLAGDIRANEQVGLTTLHTLFVREHNYWAARFGRDDPRMDGNERFQMARAVVAAEMQAITYNEFLPFLLGREALTRYTGYHPDVYPGISNEFSTAAFRLGHTLLPRTLLRLDRNGHPIAAGHLPLREAFFDPDQILVAQDGRIEPVLRGLAAQLCEDLDIYLVDDIRNFLFGRPGEGGLDLAALNIQRGRDHGLDRYNRVRGNLGLRPADGFADVSSDPVVRARLASVYDTVDDVDLSVGALAEDHRRGAMVGETVLRILKDQFERLRDGDRFWYQTYLSDSLVRMVEEETLARIIRRNTAIEDELQEEALRVTGRSSGSDAQGLGLQ